MNFQDATQLNNHKINVKLSNDLSFVVEQSYIRQKLRVRSKIKNSTNQKVMNSLKKMQVNMYDSHLISSSLMNSTIPELLQQNDDEYQGLRKRVIDRDKSSSYLPEKSFTQLLNTTQMTNYNDSFAKLQDNMSRTVRTALFGQDQELELILKEVRERPMKEKEFLKDRDVIERELQLQRRKNDILKTKELESLSTERDILQERYEQLILQATNLLNSKTGAGVKENLERVITMKRIKESIENDRARIMSMVFQIQTGDMPAKRRNESSMMAAQNILQNTQTPQQLQNQSFIDHWRIPENQMQIEQPIVYNPIQVKQDSIQINRNVEQSNKIVGEIKMWMLGMDPALQKHLEEKGTSIFETLISDNQEDYKKMSPEEKKIIHLISQEADAKRALQRIPPGTDLFYEKSAQVAQIVAMRDDLDKTVHEQKYVKIREDYERQNKEDSDQVRKLKIRKRLEDQIDGWRGERKYQPGEGLVIHWDWCLNVPKKYEKCRLTWGIFLKGVTLHRPKSVDDHLCVSDGYRVNYCMFGEHNFVYDIVANKDVILVIELQCYYKDENFRRKLDIYGWTIHELFDLNQTLIRGRFKLPFYGSSTNPSQLISSDKALNSVSNTMLYIRISFPFDYEYGKGEPLNPNALSQEYYLTGIHSKTIIRPDYEHQKVALRKKGYNPLAFDELFNQRKQIEEVKEEVEEEIDEKPEVIDDGWKYRELGDERKGLYVNIHELLNYFTTVPSKIRCFLTDVKRGVIKDEKGVPCSFETDAYEVQESLIKAGGNTALTSQQVYDQIKSGKKAPTNPLSGPFVFIEEEYQFFVDIDTYAHNNKAWDDLYLIFQVFDEIEVVEEEKSDNEVDFDSEAEEAKSVKSKASSKKVVNSKGKKWYAFKLFENNIMKLGRFYEFIIDPPIKKPPFDSLEVRISQSQLDFSINVFDYDMRFIEDQMAKFKMLRLLKRKQKGKDKAPPKKDKPKKEPKVVYDWQNAPMSDRPFIENHTRLYRDRAFEKGFGIDLYIDQARFLPDNATLCKVINYVQQKIIIQFKNTNLETLFPPKSVLPDLKTTVFSPYFNYKYEIRSPRFDPTMSALMTILTVDNTNKEVRILGYSIINFFLSKATKTQPQNPVETDNILMDGCYQLPIYCQHPTLIKPFGVDRLTKLDRLPTATLLVRTILAPMSDDGLKPLSMKDFAQKDWELKKIFQKAPPYGTGLYNTDLCQIRDTEKDLYNFRMQRIDIPQVELVARLMAYENMTKQMTIAETLQWLDQKLVRDAYTDIIELVYFAKYKPQVGFKISIDGFHNVPDTNNPFVAVYLLNPPGTFYLDKGGFDVKDVLTCTSYNWESALQSPQFNEGYFKFKDVPFQKNAHVIIDVRKITFSERGTKSKIEKVAWTIVPLFTQNGFVKSGNYQIPLFKGEVPPEIVKELQRGDPWDILQEKLKIRKGGLKYLEPTSVIVRLLDGHREGHFQNAFDHSRMIWTLLPQDKMSSYVYNEGVEAKLKSARQLLSLAPNKDKLNEFNEKVTKTLYDSIGLKQEQQDSGQYDGANN